MSATHTRARIRWCQSISPNGDLGVTGAVSVQAEVARKDADRPESSVKKQKAKQLARRRKLRTVEAALGRHFGRPRSLDIAMSGGEQRAEGEAMLQRVEEKTKSQPSQRRDRGGSQRTAEVGHFQEKVLGVFVTESFLAPLPSKGMRGTSILDSATKRTSPTTRYALLCLPSGGNLPCSFSELPQLRP